MRSARNGGGAPVVPWTSSWISCRTPSATYGLSHQIGFNITGTRIGQNSARFKAAANACKPLLPGGGP